MRCLFFGFIWFILFSILLIFVAGAFAGNSVAEPTHPQTAAEILATSQAAGEDFGAKYGGLLILGALVLSVAGTALGILPGTKRKTKEVKR